MRRTVSTGQRLALAALLGSLTLAGFALRRALVLDVDTMRLPGVAPAELPDFRNHSGDSPDRHLLAVEADPFRPERRRPAERFRLPGEAVSEALAVEETHPQSGTVQLIGTVVMPNGGSFAMTQVGGEPPRMMRVGESIGGYSLRSIDRGRAVFVAAGGTRVEVQVPKSGS
jgi:hypothetical protein